MPRQWSLFAVSLVMVLAVCSRAARPAREGALSPPDGRRIIDQEAIEQSGARTAWDALRRTVPFYAFRTNSRGRPTRVEHRGRSSIVSRDQPLILVDGVELKDFTALGDMPASDMLDIEVLTAVDATTYYGTNATNRVIRIRTNITDNNRTATIDPHVRQPHNGSHSPWPGPSRHTRMMQSQSAEARLLR